MASHHEHAGQGRPAREVAGEERLVAGEPPEPACPLPGFELEQLVDEQERRPMRQQVDRSRQAWQRGQARFRGPLVHESARACCSLNGVSLGLILYQAWAILPFSSIRKAERMMPM